MDTATESNEWRLAHILKGHTSDVKALHSAVIPSEDASAPASEVLFTASRDCTSRAWVREVGEGNNAGEWREAGAWKDPQNRYLNAVCYVAGAQPQVITAGLSNTILTFPCSLSTHDPSAAPVSKPRQTLQGHEANVTSLDSILIDSAESGPKRMLVSSSWDGSARTWSRYDVDEEWKAESQMWHECAVWDAKFLPAADGEGEVQVLTSGADSFIRLWYGSTFIRVWKGHTDVARSLVLLSPPISECSTAEDKLPPFYPSERVFLSTSNDGTSLVHSLDARRSPAGIPTSGGDPVRKLGPPSQSASYVYTADVRGAEVISAGEEGAVRGWKWQDEQLEFTIAQPTISIWSVLYLPLSGDVVAASNDGLVRVYSRRAAPPVSAESAPTQLGSVTALELEEHATACEDVARKLGRLDGWVWIDRAQLDAEAQADASLEHSARPNSTIIAEEKEVERVGEKVLLDGTEYDAVLHIDVKDDEEALPLGLNAGDDPQVVAKSFAEKHSLPDSYVSQIADFIKMVGPKSGSQ